MKKVLSLLIVLCMLIGTVPVFAEEEQSIPETWQIVYDWRNKTSLFWAEIDGDTCIIKAVAQYQNDELIIPCKERLYVKVDPVHSTIGDPITVSTLLIDKDALKKGADMVQTITFADGWEVLPDGLCEGMYSLKTVNLSKSVYAIGNNCFKNCENLENINLDNVQHIGTDAFLGTKIDTEPVADQEPIESATTASSSVETEALRTTSHLGIIQGYEDGTFNLNGTLTRAEAAAIIVRILNLEISATGAETMFSDVPSTHWASGYIKWASEYNIINGKGDGTFAPDESVTHEQMIKMLVHVLGYDPVAMANGGWNNGGYITAAEKMGLIDKEPENKNAPITRGEVALLCYKALDIDFMQWVESPTGIYGNMYTIRENENILTVYWDYEKLEGVIKESGGNVLIKVTKNYDDKSDYIIGQVFTIEDESNGEYTDSIVTLYIKKTPDAKNDILLVKLAAK